MAIKDVDALTDVKTFPLDFSRMIYMQYQEVDNSLRHADLKAQVVMGINAILFAAVTNLATGQGLTIVSQEFNFSTDLTILALNLIVFMCLLFSTLFALATIFPRFKPTETAHSFFYFGDIIQDSENDYLDHYLDMTLDDVKLEVMAQIRAKAFIVSKKFYNVRRSMVFLFLALLVWAGVFGIMMLNQV